MTTVFIISAPSGSGKSTLVSELRRRIPSLDFSVSYTTRQPRGQEQNGQDYFFIAREEFEKRIAAGEFLEWAEVFGNYYGTARRFLREAQQKGHDLLLDIDVQGAEHIKQKLPDAISIFVLPPDRKTLEWRLRKRSEDREDVIQRRLVTATREIENYDKYNYILVNDRLVDSIENLQAIFRSERFRGSDQALSEEENRTLALAEVCKLSNIRERVQPILASFAVTAVPGGNV